MAGNILIVDDVATNRIVLKAKLKGARYNTFLARNGEEALQRARTERPDLVLLDADLPDIPGLEICRRLRIDAATASIPIIMMSATPSAETRLASLRAGASDHLAKPIDELILLARMRSLLRERETDEELRQREETYRALGFAEAAPDFAAPPRIALVADRAERAVSWRAALERSLRGSRPVILDRDAALAAAAEANPPDAFVVAADLGHPGDGLRLLSELRSRPGTRQAVICIAAEDRDTAAIALDLGASDLLPLMLNSTPLAEEAALRLRSQIRRKQRHDRQRGKLADGLRLAMIDPLTGLFNRRYAMPHLIRMAERSNTIGRPLAVMVLDLDHFKSINDTFGHIAGDQVLIEVSRRLSANLRTADLIARIGGEEFLVAMPETNLHDAHRAAERLRSVIERSPVRVPDGPEIPVTLSVGFALGGETAAPRAPVESLISLADGALLGCKSGGRNQVRYANATTA